MENFGSWSVLTASYLIVLYLAMGGVVFSSILHLVNAKWRFQVRNLACSLASLFPLAFVILLILLANGESTFQWLGHAHDGDHHMPGWHDYTFLVTRQIIGFLAVAALYFYFIKFQHESEIDPSYAAQRRFRNIALLVPFAHVIYGSVVAWDFEMTMVPGWHSALYGFYHFQSNFHMFLGFFTILLFFLQRNGALMKPVPVYIFNYMAQFMLAMTILWTYLYFAPYLIMWYGRLPDEMTRYWNMMYHDLAPLWWGFLALKFIIPFVTLAITPNRHNPPVVVAVAISIFVGAWIERYTWIAGSVDTTHYHLPLSSFVDWIYLLAVVGVSWFVVRATMIRYRLIRSSKGETQTAPQ